MKKYKSIVKAVLLSCTLALTTSCNDFLDKAPDDQLTMEMIFTDKIRTEDWLAGVYSSIPSPMWGYFKAQGYNIMGDDITIPQDWSPYGWGNVYAYTTGNWSPISTWDPYYWVELHKRITFRPYLLARGKSSSGKRPDGILCQPDEVRSPLPDSLLLLFDD